MTSGTPTAEGQSEGPPPGDHAGTRRVLGNVAWMVFAEAFGKIASFVFVLIVARGLGVRDYGLFNFAISFVPLFLMLGDLGVDFVVLRELARDERRLPVVFSTGFAVRATSALAAWGVALATAPALLDDGDALVAVALVGLALVLDEGSSFLATLFKYFERLEYRAVTIVANRVVSTVLALVAVARGAGLVTVSIAYLAGSAGAFLFGLVALARHFPNVRLAAPRRDVAVALVRQGAPLGFASALNMALFRVDVVLLQVMRGPSAVALYGIAYRFFESFLFVGWSLSGATISRIARHGPSPYSATLARMTIALALAFYAPLLVGSLFLADDVVTALFSERFAAAAPAVPWLATASVFYAFAYLARTALIAFGRRAVIVWVAGVTLVLNVLVNLVLIPRYGVSGAAAATTFAEVVEATVLVTVFARMTGRIPFGRLTLPPLVAGLVMAVALAATGAGGLAGIGLGLGCYLVALAASARLLAPADVQEALAAVRPRR